MATHNLDNMIMASSLLLRNKALLLVSEADLGGGGVHRMQLHPPFCFCLLLITIINNYAHLIINRNYSSSCNDDNNNNK